MKPIIELIFQKFGYLLAPLDGYKSYIIGSAVLLIGIVTQDAELTSIGLLALTGRQAIRKLEVK